MNKSLRNTLRNAITSCRTLLERATSDRLQGEFGIHGSGLVEEAARMTHLSLEDQHFRGELVKHLEHIRAGGVDKATSVEQLKREIAYTHLNRLCALKMMETRKLIRQAVSRGLDSSGFKFYLADHPDELNLWESGQQDVAYRHYLEWLGQTHAGEIAVLFSPHDPANRLFPPHRVLLGVLELINAPELEEVWEQDEAIGWVYQYFTPKELRDTARKASPAPRNSYEMAFRNQFYTPRYVVDFLCDNTLSRLWFEMRGGRSGIAEACSLLVVRPDEVFLGPQTTPEHDDEEQHVVKMAFDLVEGDEERFAPFSAADGENELRMIVFASCVDGYQRLGSPDQRAFAWLRSIKERHLLPQSYDGASTQEILDALFLECRNDRHGGDGSVYAEPWFVAACNEVRRRALEGNPRPHFVAYRQIKDPREITVCDPACGSGHFLLGCFDRLLFIYEEAWDECPALFADLRHLERQEFLKLVPSLILRHNLHGIDIDARATQIAALALWLRAQRAWGEMGLKGKSSRPAVTRANVVCAEPMPGEDDLLAEFVTELSPRVLGDLVRRVWDSMSLAGEAGSLLQIERHIADVVAEARHAAGADLRQARDRTGQPLLFSEAQMDELHAPGQTKLDFSDISDARFWDELEARLEAALRESVQRAANGEAFSRQLFADDAERGFGFIALSMKEYDVVLMNPPFGATSSGSRAYIEKHYPRTKNDVYAAFVERWADKLTESGLLGAITSRTGFFLSSFQKWREEILLRELRPTIVADLGYGVLDTAMVETAAYCLEKSANTAPAVERMPALFLRVLEPKPEAKDAFLIEVVDAVRDGADAPGVYAVSPASFSQVPGSPFAYWISEDIRRLFATLPAFSNPERLSRIGPSTGDDTKYVRLVWEVKPTSIGRFIRWTWLNKGGAAGPYYYSYHLLIDWDEQRRTFRGFYGRPGRLTERPNGLDQFFQAGITWPARTTSGLSMRPMPEGFIFTHKGPTAFVTQPMRWLALLQSAPFESLVKLRIAAATAAARSYEVGIIQSTPVPNLNNADGVQLGELARVCVDIKRELDSANETSHAFRLPALLQVSGDSLAERAEACGQHIADADAQLAAHQVEIDDIAFRLYGIDDDDRLAMLGGDATPATLTADSDSDDAPTGDEADEDAAEDTTSAPDAAALAASLLSWAVGVAFGRWDPRVATGERTPEPLGDPFAPLPVYSPGMVPPDTPRDALPLAPAEFGLLTDEARRGESGPSPSTTDLTERVRAVLELVFPGRGESIEREACALLGVRDLRDYLAKPSAGGFWNDHLKRYSKSRRKAPIYWLLQSRGKNFGLWLSYHHLDRDLLFKALTGFVESPKLSFEERRLQELRDEKARQTEAGALPKTLRALERAIEKQEALVSELRDFRDKLRRAADLGLVPDLNDGVLLNIAPLWELVPWSEAKKTWQELLAGKYEWSSISKQLRAKGLVQG